MLLTIGELFLATVFFIGIHMCLTKSVLSSKDFWLDATWKNYTSAKANISFDYPNSWVITDLTINASPSQNEKQNLTYNSLWICPPDSQLIATPKEGVNNCIIFYTRNRILHPISAFFDEDTLFTDFSRYINDPVDEYDNFRITEQESSNDHDSNVNLIGIYRAHQAFIGMSQMQCSKEKTAECFLIFKHVLDSIEFLN